jgi:hypothetical protein
MKATLSLVTIVVLLAAGTDAGAAARRMPTTTTGGALVARPAIVVFTADGSGLLGGFTGQHPHQDTPGNPFGHLRWTTWNSDEGRAWGAQWQNDCRPSCAQGTYHAFKATVHVWDPGRTGVFLRIQVKSRYSFSYTATYVGGGWDL